MKNCLFFLAVWAALNSLLLFSGCQQNPTKTGDILQDYKDIVADEEILNHFNLNISIKKEVGKYANKEVRIRWKNTTGNTLMEISIAPRSAKTIAVYLKQHRKVDPELLLVPQLGADAHAFIAPPSTRRVVFMKNNHLLDIRVYATGMRRNTSAFYFSMENVIDSAILIHKRI